MANYEVSDLLQSSGKSIVNGFKLPFQLSHWDSVYGFFVLLKGAATTPSADITLNFQGSIDGISAWMDLGSVVTVSGNALSSEVAIYPPVGTSLRPFVRIVFTIPSDASLIMDTLKITRRL